MLNNIASSYEYSPLLDDLLELCIKHKVCITRLSYMGCNDKSYIRKGQFSVVSYGTIEFQYGYEKS